MIQAILDTASYAPHGFCLFWQPWLVGLHVAADLLIALSYFAIPFALVLFLRRRPDVQYRGLVGLFAAFILLCGVTHIVSLITLWVPIYPVQGLLKLVTGVVSAVTAVVLFFLVPRLVAIPSPRQLESANAKLRDEVSAHQNTLADLREAQQTLETKVEERTAELSDANSRLAVLTREAVHRGRNLLTIVDSIARQTARSSSDLKEFLEAFTGRILALANATASVAETQSTNRDVTDLKAVALRQLEPVILTFGDRIHLNGPSFEVASGAAQQIGLALHELATNAQKRGALSRPVGTVTIEWSVDDNGPESQLSLSWKETAVADESPPTSPFNPRFGHVLLSRLVPSTLGGVASMEFDNGFHYVLSVPVKNIGPKATFGADLVADRLMEKTWTSGQSPVSV